MSDDPIVRYIQILAAKVVVLEELNRSLLLEHFMDEDRPIALARDFFERVQRRLIESVRGGELNPATMLVEAQLSQSLAALEKTLRDAGKQQ